MRAVSVFCSACVNRRYSEVAAEVLAESTITASDTYKQAAISFFDNKFGSLVPLKATYFVG